MSMLAIQTNLNTIRILIVDDQKMIRKIIQMQLEQESDLEIVGYATNGKEAIVQIEKLAPQVVILDLDMPGMDGLTATKIIRDRFSHTKILVFSSYDDQQYVNLAIKAGAKGYLLKGTPKNELANAVRAVNQGYFQLGPGLLEKLVISLSNAAENHSRSFEENLLIALKKFKQDTNQQITKLISLETADFEHKHNININAYMQNFYERCQKIDNHLKRLELRFYQFILLNLGVWFIFLAYCLIRSR